MVCSKCGKENLEGMSFCGNCGNNLEGKIQCRSCGKWVNQEFKYCPNCASRLEVKTAPKTTQAVGVPLDQNVIRSVISNSSIIILSLFMIVFLFTSLAVLKSNVVWEEIKLNNQVNIVDYFEAVSKDLSDFGYNDIQNEAEKIDQNNISVFLNKYNLLKMYMIKELDSSFILQKYIVYVNLLIVLAMIVIPFVNLGYSIYDLTKFQKRNLCKKLFMTSFLLGLVLVVTTCLMGYVVGIGVICYVIFSSFGMIFTYVMELVHKERKFVGRTFTHRLISLVSILLIILVATGTIAKVSMKISSTKVYTESIIFSDFASLMNDYNSSFINQLSNGIIGQINYSLSIPIWVSNFSFFISLLMTIAIGFLIASLMIETARDLINPTKTNKLTPLFLWFSFGLEIMVAIILIIVTNTFQNAILSHSNANDFKFYITAGIFILITLNLSVAIYQSIVGKLPYQMK